MKTLLLPALLMIAATSASAKDIALHPGETVTIRLSGSTFEVLKLQPAADMTDYETNLVRKMQMTNVAPEATFVPPSPIYRGEIPSDPPKVMPDVVQFTFRHVGGEYRGTSVHSLLTIANGYSSQMRYRAAIEKDHHRQPTDVCGVMAAGRGAEHWPYSIDALDLSDLRFDTFDESNPPCE